MKKNHLNAKHQFKEAVSYIKSCSNLIYFSIFIFIFSAMIGFIFSDQFALQIEKYIRELISQTKDLNAIEMIFFILQNNLQSALFSVLLGIFLGIFPIATALANGVVIGFVLNKTYEIAGFTSWWRLLPHGIFELPAIFISFGLGMKLGFYIFSKNPNKTQEFKKRFYNSMNAFLMLIIPLLLIAAVIEGLLIVLLE
ncbi:stage II sporulation protein M [Candidatus Pacearchaeota archaeon]|nr:stage II sporulation protein M [Candidatus Pacearchaeota archaeon]